MVASKRVDDEDIRAFFPIRWEQVYQDWGGWVSDVFICLPIWEKIEISRKMLAEGDAFRHSSRRFYAVFFPDGHLMKILKKIITASTREHQGVPGSTREGKDFLPGDFFGIFK